MNPTRLRAFAVNGLLRDPMAQLYLHLGQCRAARGAWFPLRVVGETVHQLLAPRFVTTVVLAGVLLALTCV